MDGYTAFRERDRVAPMLNAARDWRFHAAAPCPRGEFLRHYANAVLSSLSNVHRLARTHRNERLRQ